MDIVIDKTKLEIIIIIDTFASLVVGFFIGIRSGI